MSAREAEASGPSTEERLEAVWIYKTIADPSPTETSVPSPRSEGARAPSVGGGVDERSVVAAGDGPEGVAGESGRE
jgi:hypothetical protein